MAASVNTLTINSYIPFTSRVIDTYLIFTDRDGHMSQLVGGTELEYRRKMADIFRSLKGNLYIGNGYQMGSTITHDRVREQYGDGGKHVITRETADDILAGVDSKEMYDRLTEDIDYEDLPSEEEVKARHDPIEDIKDTLVDGDYNAIANQGLETFLQHRGPEYQLWHDETLEELEEQGYKQAEEMLNVLANTPYSEKVYGEDDSGRLPDIGPLDALIESLSDL